MIGDIVLPGDRLEDLSKISGVLMLGPGLRKDTEDEKIVATRPGIINHKPPNVYWIEGHQKRYTPKKGDLVVGIVQVKRGDILKIDIGSSETASLSMFAFEGATKKQKPDVQVGDVVYARLLNANREMEPELVCVDSYFKAGKLGLLSNNGYVFNVSTEFAYSLLNYDNPLLRTLGKKTPFEICVGLNGKVWVNGKTTKDVFTILTALLAAEKKNVNDVINLCRKS